MKLCRIIDVRPILEYCSVVWNPFLLKDITAMEKVQLKDVSQNGSLV